jgi:hypothetical protein
MRLIFGIVLGALLTVGGAYVVDSSSAADAKMVNWDVVSKNVETLGTKVKQGWARLTG